MKLGFIGAGKMASAIIDSVIRARLLKPGDIVACEVDAAQRKHVARAYGIRVCADIATVARAAQTIVLAVKPQSFQDVLPTLGACVGRRHVVISIAAGKRLAGIERALPGVRVLRVMPNLNCQVGAGMSAYCGGRRATVADGRLTRRIFACSGEVVELPEKQFDALTAVSGSGPAFFAYLAQALADGGVAEGLRPADALVLAVQTMLGTGRLLMERGIAPADLIAAVSSARGTTVAGLAVLTESPVREVLAKTVAAAAARSRELSA
jgi:pyrroline-5-carboxylate reductase